MRLNGDGNIRPVVVGKREPPRVQVRAGLLRLTFTVSEALALADAIVDAAERIDHSTKDSP